MANSTTNGHNGHASGPIVLSQPRASFAAVEAEQSLLGAMILDTDARIYAAQNVQRDHFQHEPHRALFDVLLQLQAAGGAVDISTVGSALRGTPALDDLGGFGYLGALIEACHSTLHTSSYSFAVLEAWQQRQSWNATNAALDALHSRDLSAYSRALEKMQGASAWGSRAPQRFALLSSEQVEALEPPQQLIDGILPVDALVCVFGPSATYKSFLVLDMAAHIATGRDWHGRATLSGSVVYVAGEGASGLGKRHRAWRTHRGVESLPNLYTIADAPNMTKTEDAHALAQSISQLPTPPRLIVLDTLHVCMEGGDENSSRDMGLFIANAKRLKAATGATILFVHHTGNNERVRGSSSIKTDVENMIEVRAQDDRVTLFAEKIKDGPKFEPMTFQRHAVGEYPTGSLVFEPVNAEPCGKAMPQAHETVIAVLANQFPEGATPGEWEAACKQAGVKRATFYRARKYLHAANSVHLCWNKFFARSDRDLSQSQSHENTETETDTQFGQ